MNVGEAKKAVKMILSHNDQIITPFIQGKPGIGKSQIVSQIKDELNLDHLIDIRMSQHDNTDIKGVPHITSGALNWICPEFLPIEGSKWEGTSGIFFLDEINRAQPDTLQSIFEIVHDRSIGGHKFLSNWKIVAAGNIGHEDGTDVFEMDSALKNRFCFVEINEVIFADWLAWAEKHEVNKDVIEYLKINPAKLSYNVADTHITPRSWDKFSQHLNTYKNMEDKLSFVNLCGKGIIYDSHITFYDFLVNKQEVTPEDIINDYDKTVEKLKKMERVDLYNLVEQIIGFTQQPDVELTKDQKVSIGRFVIEQLDEDAQIAFVFKLKDANMSLVNDLMDPKNLPSTEKCLKMFTAPDFIRKVFTAAASK